MSIDSTTTPSHVSSFKQRVDLHLHHNKPLQSTLSHIEQRPPSRHSITVPAKDRLQQQQQQQAFSRQRAMSASEDASADTITELPSYTNKQNLKRDKRISEIRTSVDPHDQTPVERRNSTPQMYLSALIPNAFRNAKHHHKNNPKDETNTTNLTISNTNASAVTSSDIMTMKTDLPFTLRQPGTSINGSRLISSYSTERLLLSASEDSSSSSSSLFVTIDNSPELRSAESFILASRTPLSVSEIYRDYFFEYFHINYYGELEDDGPFLASLRFIYYKSPTSDTCEARAIVRTQFRNYDVSEIANSTNETNILQILFNKGQLPPVRSYGTIGDPKANEKIYLFDKINDERYHCKIGVIYQGLNQTTEYDIFCNDELPDDMRDFLGHISNRIYLKGFPKYRGDLDIKDDLHGEYSYYTEYENHEIMFNIAPLIPSTKANRQCVERKGLIGNAFVCIVFQEPGANFSPDLISGKVTQIYITVQPMKIYEQLYYKVGLWRRNEITSVIDPPGGIFLYDQSFAAYFLTLILNAVNTAVESPSLRSRIFEQRQRLKFEELRKLANLFSFGPIPEFTPESEHIHYQVDMRPSTRSESFASTTTSATSDSASTTPGRTSPVATKKKGFSRKIFNVFAGRSQSVSSPPAPPINVTNDGLVANPPSTTPALDAAMTLGRGNILSNKDSSQRLRSSKPNQAPIPPLRSINSSVPPSVVFQPATPSVITLNPFISDNVTKNNLLNTAAWDVEPRNRSNSSPDDRVNNNTPHSYLVSRIDEESPSTITSEEEDSKEDLSEDDLSMDRPLTYSSNRNSSSVPYLS